MSTGSRDHLSSVGGLGSGYGAGWKLPDKLRIVKPLEGSLTLHNWQRLAQPHLGNALEERQGVAVRGSLPKRGGGGGVAGYHRSSGFSEDLGGLSDFEEESESELEISGGWMDPTRTHNTFTNCTVLHPDEFSASQTQLTPSYGGVQISSGFDELSRSASRMSASSSRPASSLSSRRGSISEPGYRRAGTLTFSSNIGLARVLNERHISGHLTGSTLSLDTGSVVGGGDFRGRAGTAGSSLTPSIISTPAGLRSFSPTGTPLNSPTHTPPGSPKAEAPAGIVASFFSSLKTALYGEQQKEIKLKRRKRTKSNSAAAASKFGILERVEEVGVENLLVGSPAPSRESSLSRSSSEMGDMAGSRRRRKQTTDDAMPHAISDFDLRFAHEDRDELEDIRPGTLTRNKSSGDYVQDPTIGQLNAPSFSMFGRPSLHPQELGRVPSPAFDVDQQAAEPGRKALGGGAFVGGRGPGRAVSAPGEKRPQLLGLMGVPGQPGTGALLQPPGEMTKTAASLRPDLGSVPLTKSPVDDKPQGGGFIGSLTTMFFGRKGGLL